ncbi:hypothetical protein [Pseudomonas sp. PB3P13]
MLDAVALVAQVMEMKGVDFLFRNVRTIGPAENDLEGFTGIQRQNAVDGIELRQLQVPALAETAVGGVECVKRQLQGNDRATEVIGLEFRQRDGAGVLPGARVDLA